MLASFRWVFIVHPGGIGNRKERFVGLNRALHEVIIRSQGLFIHGAHTLHR